MAKVQLDVKETKKVLQALKPFTTDQSTLNILKFVKLVKSNGKSYIAASDIESYAAVKLDIEGDNSVVCLHLKEFVDALSEAKTDKVTVEIEDGELVPNVSVNGKKVSAMDDELFPVVPSNMLPTHEKFEESRVFRFKVKVGEFIEAVESVLWAVKFMPESYDFYRFNVLYFLVYNDAVNVLATNSYMLAMHVITPVQNAELVCDRTLGISLHKAKSIIRSLTLIFDPEEEIEIDCHSNLTQGFVRISSASKKAVYYISGFRNAFTKERINTTITSEMKYREEAYIFLHLNEFRKTIDSFLSCIRAKKLDKYAVLFHVCDNFLVARLFRRRDYESEWVEINRSEIPCEKVDKLVDKQVEFCLRLDIADALASVKSDTVCLIPNEGNSLFVSHGKMFGIVMRFSLRSDMIEREEGQEEG